MEEWKTENREMNVESACGGRGFNSPLLGVIVIFRLTTRCWQRGGYCLGRGLIGKGCNFIILEDANWIILMPILNILGCFKLNIACLMVEFGADENLLDVLTQYEILEFMDCLHSMRHTSFGLVRFDKANQ